MKIDFENKTIPRNGKGDPAFAALGITEGPLAERWPAEGISVLSEFTPAEVCELVNRSLYQILYQKESHRKRAASQRELERPIKVALRRLFPNVSFVKATDEQLRQAVKYVSEHPEEVVE